MASRINILKDDEVEMGTLILSYWFEWFWEIDKYNHEKRPDDIELEDFWKTSNQWIAKPSFIIRSVLEGFDEFSHPQVNFLLGF